MNFLEQLAAEYYEYKGNFVRTNIKFGPRARGGYIGEIDVAAYNPETCELIHIETSTDAYSRAKREKRFRKKFLDAKNHYLNIFPFKGSFKQIAILGFSDRVHTLNFGKNIIIKSIPEFINEIHNEFRTINPARKAIPESYPLLRTIQYSIFYFNRNYRH